MRLAIILSALLTLMSYSFALDEKELVRVAQKSDAVVVAEVIDTPPSLLAFWSGLVPSIQHVHYKVIEVRKGEVKSTEIDAGHIVVYNSFTADKNEPRLSPALFKPGNRILLLLSQENSLGCKAEDASGNLEVFCSPNENYGAVLAERNLVEKVRRSLR